jgi:membrane-bound lytic murein transglycosylase B
MTISKTFKLIFILTILISNFTFESKSEESFESWLSSYKKEATKNGISQETVNLAFKNVRYLEQVIKYDRKQPEFYEDTETYVSKRASLFRVTKAKKILRENQELFNEIENKFFVEKEILLALWGIETNFGKHVGKMDTISSLATLSYDKRRRDFFSSELLILLQLIDDKMIDVETLYGSWAGAFGNFQFMPSSIKRYAIDYDNNNKIELKNSIEDSIASAANYMNSMGWKRNEPCFYKVKINKEVKKKYINSSARNISNRLRISKWKKRGVIPIRMVKNEPDLLAALVLPDGKINTPSFLVFDNYEKILKWNRSLRFGVTVCTLASMIKE